ncbi:MAG: ProQ/FINO family protein [Thiolinea sp.]
MTDKPKKRLSLKQKADTPTPDDNATQSRTRSRKRIILRDDLPAAKLSTTKAPPKPKPKKKPKPPAPKKPVISPSDIRLDNLNASLNSFDIWRNFQPLMIGIEKDIFRHIAKHQLSCSKRVVQRLLRQHTADERYQRNLKTGMARHHLNGAEAVAGDTALSVLADAALAEHRAGKTRPL